jgi:hypothetical protein
MAYRQSLMKYAEKYGISQISRKCNKSRPESLYRVMRKMGMFPEEKPKKSYSPKPYKQMTHPGERVQIDVADPSLHTPP